MLGMKQPLEAVQYVGRRASWTDNLYGSGLTFARGQVRKVPASLAGKFLRHSDVFARPDDSSEPPETEQPEQPDDDTSAQLEQAQKYQQEAVREQVRTQEVLDRVERMSKAALQEFAQQHYQQTLPHALRREDMVDKVRELVHRFGALA